MKKLYKFSLFITILVVACASFSSCGIDSTEDDPDFPLYVTYTISVYNEKYSGPNQVLTMINKWVENNKTIKDERVDYKTGAPEEFASMDQEYINKYNEFVPKFKAFLEETKTKLANGSYGDVKQVNGHFVVYCSRIQGQGNQLASEGIDFTYPDPSGNGE